MKVYRTEISCVALQEYPDMQDFIVAYLNDGNDLNVDGLWIWNEFPVGFSGPRRSPQTGNVYVNLPWILEQERGREIVAKFLLTH